MLQKSVELVVTARRIGIAYQLAHAHHFCFKIPVGVQHKTAVAWREVIFGVIRAIAFELYASGWRRQQAIVQALYIVFLVYMTVSHHAQLRRVIKQRQHLFGIGDTLRIQPSATDGQQWMVHKNSGVLVGVFAQCGGEPS